MYTLKPLPFEIFSVEPFIDTHTIGLHYYKHQDSYLKTLNKILEKYNFNYPIEDLYDHLNEIKDEDKNDVIFTSVVLQTMIYTGKQLIQIVKNNQKKNYSIP